MPLVFRVANRCVCNRHDAEDVTQQVLLAFCSAPPGSILALDQWLYVATTRAARDWIRSARSRQQRERKDLPMSTDNVGVLSEDPAQLIEANETAVALQAALVDLRSLHSRTIWSLFHRMMQSHWLQPSHDCLMNQSVCDFSRNKPTNSMNCCLPGRITRLRVRPLTAT